MKKEIQTMSKEEFSKLMPTPRKCNDPMRNISCPYLTQHEVEHTVVVNPSDEYLCIDGNLVSILAQLTGEQLKSIFQALDKCKMSDIGTEAENAKDPMVEAILNVIDNKDIQMGRYIIDYVGQHI